MKPFKKLLSWKLALFFIASLSTLSVVYLALDWKNIQIDRYNFEQLEKVKPILESIPADAPKFYSLKEFNEQYKADIKPIENCYYVSSNNGSEKYIFGFMLESQKYKKVFGTREYAYPKYNLPTGKNCFGMGGNPGCLNYKDIFVEIISHPCEN